MIQFLLVALGGALGAVCRYGISLIPFKTSFPFQTLVVNVLGAMCIGFLMGLWGAGRLGERESLLLKTGFCGGFTTFSTFSLEVVVLLDKNKWGLAGMYMGISVLLCVGGVLMGRLAAARLMGV